LQDDESSQSADWRRSGKSQTQSAGKQRASADLHFQSEQRTSLVNPAEDSHPLANQQLAGGNHLLTHEEPGWISQSNATSDNMEAEFGFESTESSSLIVDLVELQLNSWGRKVAALKENKMADQPKPGEKDESSDSSVEYFTELTSVSADDSVSVDLTGSTEPLMKKEPRDGSGVKVYFRNLTPDSAAAGPAYRPKFLNLTPEGYRTNVEDRPDTSFEDVGEKKIDDQEARVQSLGRTGITKYTNI